MSNLQVLWLLVSNKACLDLLLSVGFKLFFARVVVLSDKSLTAVDYANLPPQICKYFPTENRTAYFSIRRALFTAVQPSASSTQVYSVDTSHYPNVKN